MKSILNLIGIILVILGISILAYRGFSYTKQEKLAQIGNVELTSNTQKTIYFSPLTGIVSVVSGIVLIAIVRINK